MIKAGDELVDLTFNRKIINSFTEPVKNYYLQFKDLNEQQERIYKFLEIYKVKLYWNYKAKYLNLYGEDILIIRSIF